MSDVSEKIYNEWRAKRQKGEEVAKLNAYLFTVRRYCTVDHVVIAKTMQEALQKLTKYYDTDSVSWELLNSKQISKSVIP